MARNEEKQLARLNRFYLQQQKEEELRKRPPRPRLEVLSTLDDVKKWIPSILKDIEFYVKQMEVSCYPKKTIEQFEQRINHLRGEYKAFVRKAHELEPDLSATPWSDRPYSSKRQKLSKNEGNSGADAEPLTTTDAASCKIGSKVTSFVPLSTPLLLQVKSCPEFYGCRKSGHHASPEMSVVNQDQPLDFDFTGTKKLGHTELLGSASSCTDDACNDMRLNGQKASEGDTYSDLMNKENGVSIQRNSICNDEVSSLKSTRSGSCSVNQSLNLPYSDSSSDEET